MYMPLAKQQKQREDMSPHQRFMQSQVQRVLESRIPIMSPETTMAMVLGEYQASERPAGAPSAAMAMAPEILSLEAPPPPSAIVTEKKKKKYRNNK
jgi:hypothetical protein